jgi:hypothetical protein
MRINTVFNKIQDPPKHPNEVLAIFFHRTAAVLYFIYAIWGISSIALRIPSISEELGSIPQIVFSALVVLVTVPCCIGATFFPRLGRLELFSSSSFAMLLVIYEGLILIEGLEGNMHHLVSFILILSTLVVPVSRASFIYWTLTAQAKGRLWRS